MKAFEEALGLTGVEEIIETQPAEQELVVLDDPEEELSDAEKDFQLARNNLLSAVAKTNEALQKSMMIANDKEDARSFEVVNQLINTLVSSSNSLVDVHKKKPAGAADQIMQDGKIINNTQNNIVFNGTPKQLKEFITKMKEQEAQQISDQSDS